MTVFAGHYGQVELKRVGGGGSINARISPANLLVSRKRINIGDPDGIDLPNGTITTGDRIRLTTSDSRGLPLRLYTNAANTTYIDNPGAGVLPIEFFANVDAMGAIRMYRSFSDAINNPGVRFLAVPLSVSALAAPWQVDMSIVEGGFHKLGQVKGFTFSTDRDSTEITSLGERFKNFAQSGISGSGTVDCLFSFKNLNDEEIPLALCELVQKIEAGAKFAGKFYLLEPRVQQIPGYATNEGVWYEVNGIMTRAGITVQSDQIVECSFDFISAGAFALKSGVTPVEITTEADVRIGTDADLTELGLLVEAN
jgi:hypothetical protein